MAAPSQARATSDLRRGVFAGLIVAVGLVALAVMMRPEVASSPAPVATAVGSAPSPDPAQAAAGTANSDRRDRGAA